MNPGSGSCAAAEQAGMDAFPTITQEEDRP